VGPVRTPAVAGMFYPSHPAQLRTAVERLLVREREARPVRAAVVPHAGYIYSGATAGRVYACAALPVRLLVLCPNHTGIGPPVSVYARGAWRTPLGEVPVDEALASSLLEACPLCEADESAHRREHAIEVQLPFLQVLLGEPRVVPVVVGTSDFAALASLGAGLAEAVRSSGGEAAILVSSDMNHYESARENRRKDDLALAPLLALDAAGLHRVVREQHISMCGAAPAVAAIVAARALGAAEADLVDYTHSGQVTGDDEEVVSYAGVRIFKEAA